MLTGLRAKFMNSHLIVRLPDEFVAADHLDGHFGGSFLDDRIKHLFRNNRPRKVRMLDAASCSATETSSPSPDRSERHIQSCGMKGENDFSSNNRWRRRH